MLRIIHEINYSTQVISHAEHLYARPVKDRDKPSSGFRVSALVVECNHEHESIPLEIEGDAACILEALENVCASIRARGQEFVKRGELEPSWRDWARKLQDEWQRVAKERRAKRKQ